MWRGRAERRAFHSLLYMEKPPFPVVRHFSAILNFNAEDYDKDLQLQVYIYTSINFYYLNKILIIDILL